MGRVAAAELATLITRAQEPVLAKRARCMAHITLTVAGSRVNPKAVSHLPGAQQPVPNLTFRARWEPLRHRPQGPIHMGCLGRWHVQMGFLTTLHHCAENGIEPDRQLWRARMKFVVGFNSRAGST